MTAPDLPAEKRDAQIAEVLAAHQYGGVLGDYEIAPYFRWIKCNGCDWTQNIAGMSGWTSWVRAHADHQADALAPLIADMLAEAKGEALREAAEAVRSSVSYGFGMNPDGTEDPQAAAYAEGLRDAWQIVRLRAEANGQEGE